MNAFVLSGFVVFLMSHASYGAGGVGTGAGTVTGTGYGTGAADSKIGPELKDSQIIHILTTLNNSEIAAAEVAKSKANDKSVKNFANMMITHHSKSNTDLDQLMAKLNIKSDSDQIAEDLKKSSTDKLNVLKNEMASNFNYDYMDAQVSGHQDALKLVTETLIPKAKSPELISLLKKTQGVVKSHLDEATRIQASLKRN